MKSPQIEHLIADEVKRRAHLVRARRRPLPPAQCPCHCSRIIDMIAQKRSSPRAEHRLRQLQRANESVSLAEKFPNLKSLTVHLTYFGPDGLTQNGEVRYTVHVGHAKSMFSFTCQGWDCVGGDFDLSEAVAAAVTARSKAVHGELRCQGLRNGAAEGKQPCHNLLRYKLLLGYV